MRFSYGRSARTRPRDMIINDPSVVSRSLSSSRPFIRRKGCDSTLLWCANDDRTRRITNLRSSNELTRQVERWLRFWILLRSRDCSRTFTNRATQLDEINVVAITSRADFSSSHGVSTERIACVGGIFHARARVNVSISRARYVQS